MKSLRLRIPPPAVALIAAGLMWADSWLSQAVAPPTDVRMLVIGAAIVIAIAGIGVSLSGVIAFRQARTTVNPLAPEKTSYLVTSGIYRFTRNPMYLGLFLVLLGWALFLFSIWALLGPAAFMLYMNQFQIEPEEEVLARKFGAEFSNYCDRVRRWI